MSSAPRLVLASASPRRRELLERVGLLPIVVPAEIDESTLPGEHADDYVVRVAADKAHAVAVLHPGAVVVAADTAVVLDGVPLGKPAGPADALEMLSRLSGRTHQVLSSVVVVDPDGIEHTALARATVTMAPSSDEERAWYVATGEPMDKAGAYGVQGIGAVLVERVEGDPTTVIGLPLRTTLDLLRAAGVDWTCDAPG
jgi:septum formation protein